MELPSVVLFFLFYVTGSGIGLLLPILFFSLWEMHYLYRTFAYPLLIRPGAAMPVSIVAMGAAFNFVNGPLNAIALTHLPFNYPEGWLSGVRLLAGIAIFIAGFAINIQSDNIL